MTRYIPNTIPTLWLVTIWWPFDASRQFERTQNHSYGLKLSVIEISLGISHLVVAQ